MTNPRDLDKEVQGSVFDASFGRKVTIPPPRPNLMESHVVEFSRVEIQFYEGILRGVLSMAK